MSKRPTKHVLIQAPTHRQAVKVSGDLDCSLSEYADAAVAYFAERGLDPRATRAREGVQIIDEIRKMGDRIFSFLQVQERGLLLPMGRIMLDAMNHASSARRLTLRQILHQTQQQDFEAKDAEAVTKLAEMSDQGMDLLMKTLQEASKTSRRKQDGLGQ